MKHLIAPIAIAALLMTGCSGPEKDAEYESINDFSSAYEKGIGDGMECDRTDRDIQDNSWIFTNCGQHTILMMFTSDEKRKEIKDKNPVRAGNRWVQGKNWLIEAPQYEAEKAQVALGGDLLK